MFLAILLALCVPPGPVDEDQPTPAKPPVVVKLTHQELLQFMLRPFDKPEGTPDHEPTEEVAGLIKELGSDKWLTRETAQQRLAKIGLPALDKLEQGMFDKDLEVSVRCQGALRHYYLMTSEKITFVPGIWSLPRTNRIDDLSHNDLAKLLYEETRELQNEAIRRRRSEPFHKKEIWRDRGVEERASLLYFGRLQRLGVSKLNVSNLIGKMVESPLADCSDYRGSNDYGSQERWLKSMPEPVQPHVGYEHGHCPDMPDCPDECPCWDD